MRIALFILLTVTLICCKKSGNTFNDRLANKWEIRMSMGGFAGAQKYEPGNGHILAFKSDNTYNRIYKDSIRASGTYELSYIEKNKYKITFHANGGKSSDEVTMKRDTLFFSSLDLFFSSIYVKVN